MQYVRKGALNHAASFDRPNFVEVADGGAELKLHAFAVGIIWIDYVRPVKAAWPKTRVSGVVRGNGVSLRSRQRPGGGRRCCRRDASSAHLWKPVPAGLSPGERAVAHLGIAGERRSRT